MFVFVQAYKCLYLFLLVTSEAGFDLKIGMNGVMLKVPVYSYYGLERLDFESQ